MIFHLMDTGKDHLSLITAVPHKHWCKAQGGSLPWSIRALIAALLIDDCATWSSLFVTTTLEPPFCDDNAASPTAQLGTSHALLHHRLPTKNHGGGDGLLPGGGGGDALTCTWNIAAVNNNPLEYWTTYDSPGYMQLMVDVERMIDSPGERDDVPLGTIFPAFEDLATRMAAVEGLNEGVDEVRAIWESDLSKRPLVSGFLKDKAIGSKRFISMPDRFTNTINLASSSEPACRPAVTNNYVGDLGSFEAWWAAWAAFMFDTELSVSTKSGPASKAPCKLLSKISRAKYPALSEEEERVSLPMQVLCLALFDCALVHMMNTLSPSGEWLTIKRRLCDALFVNKQARTLEILSGAAYASCDVIFLQEVAGNFVAKLQGSPLGKSHHVLAPAKLDSARDQNSVVLSRRAPS